MMKLEFSKSAIKFFNNLSKKEQSKIKQKLNLLVYVIVETGNIPFQELDIKTLKGDWKDYLRLRVGKIRIIFKINIIDNELLIYEIDYRGSVYK